MLQQLEMFLKRSCCWGLVTPVSLLTPTLLFYFCDPILWPLLFSHSCGGRSKLKKR